MRTWDHVNFLYLFPFYYKFFVCKTCFFFSNYNDSVFWQTLTLPSIWLTVPTTEQQAPPTPPPVTNDCHLPPDHGPCDGVVTRWHFNVTSQRCEQFQYGGCQGNWNNFQDQATCEHLCGQKFDLPCPANQVGWVLRLLMWVKVVSIRHAIKGFHGFLVLIPFECNCFFAYEKFVFFP